MGRSFHQPGTVNENVLESDFEPLCDGTTRRRSHGNGKHADHFRFVVDACSELNLRQANYLSSIFYLKFRFYTQ